MSAAAVSSDYLLNQLSSLDCSEDPAHIQDLIQWAKDLREVGAKWLDLPSAIAEFNTQQFGWFKQGLLLDRVYRGNRWKDYAKRWRDWTEKFLGHTPWYCRNLMKAAQVVMVLLAEGFTVLPRCLAQCEPLFKYLTKDGGQDLIDKWQEVVNAHPVDHHRSAAAIKETLGEIDPPKKKRLGLSPDLHAALYRRAAYEGKSPEDLIREWLGEDIAPTPEPHETTPPTPAEDAIAHWQDDVTQLIQEHDHDYQNTHTPRPEPCPSDHRTESTDSGASGIGDRVHGRSGDQFTDCNRIDPRRVGRGSGRGDSCPTHDRSHSPGNGGTDSHDPLDALHPL